MLQGNLGWALMQQNNYIEAEDAYRRALLIAPDNNKMCNLGICLMKQGRIGEAKETLRRVKPAVAHGPRGIDSHLKAYERAQQMLKDLESEMMNKGNGDRVEQSRLFDAFLGSSAIWQPQPCKEHTVVSSTTNLSKPKFEFADENVNSNNLANQIVFPGKSSAKQLFNHGNSNSLNIAAPPFYSSKLVKEQNFGSQFPESLKRTRSANGANLIGANELGDVRIPIRETENKTRRISTSPEKNKWTDLLPDSKDFEEAIIAAVLGSSCGSGKLDESKKEDGKVLRKVDKRLSVFQDITPSLSPRA